MIDPKGEPTEPKLRILQINLIGVLYTLKLALHYFRVHPEAETRDRCFIFKGSIAGLLDQPGSWQYSTSKFGLRGLMRTMRRTSWSEGIRVNLVAPWSVSPCQFYVVLLADVWLRYTQTTIMSDAVVERLKSKGVEFSLCEDCTAAMLRIATDKAVNGAYLERSQKWNDLWRKLKSEHRADFGHSSSFASATRIS
jgi:NAD(P)-dependent dehydrogenase (short-subunit alcohol dehydrogenase family)